MLCSTRFGGADIREQAQRIVVQPQCDLQFFELGVRHGPGKDPGIGGP